MSDQSQSLPVRRRRVGLALLVPIVMLLTMVQVLLAQEVVEPAGVPANIVISKTANQSELVAGNTLQYTIVISNDGGTTASGVLLTDTVPIEFEIDINSVDIPDANGVISESFDATSDVLTWGATIDAGSSATIHFNATLTDTVSTGTVITNTAEADLSGSVVTSEYGVEVTEVTTYITYLPIVFKRLPTPNLLSAGVPTSGDNFATYSILVTWEDIGLAGGTYEVQEANSPDFSNPTLYSAGSATSKSVTHAPSFKDTQFYYRVRFLKDGQISNWSNVVTQFGVYADFFEDSSSGWAIRRHDTDDTNDSISYTSGKLKLKVGGRWDSIIASPLVPVPYTWQGYSIETRAQLGDGIDNLHSYGVVFGADWNGVTPCPASNLLSCFNSYYRLNLIWDGSSDFVGQVKRIDSHDPPNNKDHGIELMSPRHVRNTDPNGWNTFRFDVYANGTIYMFANGQLFWSGNDASYTSGLRYFGAFASANEYLGSAPYFEYYKITPLP